MVIQVSQWQQMPEILGKVSQLVAQAKKNRVGRIFLKQILITRLVQLLWKYLIPQVQVFFNIIFYIPECITQNFSFCFRFCWKPTISSIDRTQIHLLRSNCKSLPFFFFFIIIVIPLFFSFFLALDLTHPSFPTKQMALSSAARNSATLQT